MLTPSSGFVSTRQPPIGWACESSRAQAMVAGACSWRSTVARRPTGKILKSGSQITLICDFARDIVIIDPQPCPPELLDSSAEALAQHLGPQICTMHPAIVSDWAEGTGFNLILASIKRRVHRLGIPGHQVTLSWTISYPSNKQPAPKIFPFQ